MRATLCNQPTFMAAPLYTAIGATHTVFGLRKSPGTHDSRARQGCLDPLADNCVIVKRHRSVRSPHKRQLEYAEVTEDQEGRCQSDRKNPVRSEDAASIF